MAMSVLDDKTVEPSEEQVREARKYAEGRGIRVEVRKKADVEHIKMLTEIKPAN